MTAGAGVASAAPEPPVTSQTIDSAEIQAAPVAPAAATETNDFVLEQAQAGRSVDASTVRTAAVQGVTLVYEQNQVVSKVTVDRSADPADAGNGAEGLGLSLADPAVPDEEDPAPTTPCKPPACIIIDDPRLQAAQLTTGAGLAASVNGATQQAGACSTLKGSRGNLTSCWARYKVKDDNKNADYFFYDRWATANGKSLTGPDNIAVKIDLRSQARASGSNISGLADYAPRTAIKNCTQAGDVSLGYQGLSVSMPLSECDEVTPYPDAGAKKMRNVYDQGAIFSGRTHGLEMGVVFSTPNKKTSSADHYSYARFCRVSYLSCSSLSETPHG